MLLRNKIVGIAYEMYDKHSHHKTGGLITILSLINNLYQDNCGVQLKNRGHGITTQRADRFYNFRRLASTGYCKGTSHSNCNH